MKKIIFVMGLTCSGKTTMIEAVQKFYPVGLIQVGKEMRRRHPPEYFKGLGAMDETEDEVWGIFLEQLASHADKEVILVDGQPRSVTQVEKCIDLVRDREKVFVWLATPVDEIKKRAEARDDSEAAKELTMQRIVNDSRMYAGVKEYLSITEKIHDIQTVTKLLELIYGP